MAHSEVKEPDIFFLSCRITKESAEHVQNFVFTFARWAETGLQMNNKVSLNKLAVETGKCRLTSNMANIHLKSDNMSLSSSQHVVAQ